MAGASAGLLLFFVCALRRKNELSCVVRRARGDYEKVLQRGAHAQCREQCREAGVVAFAVGRNQGELVFVHAGVFLCCIAETQEDDFLGICLAAAQAGFQLSGRHVDVDIGIGAADDGIIAGADAGCALHIDVHDHVLASLQEVDDIALERAVAVAVHGGVLQEFASCHLGGKYLRGEEVVVDSVLLTGARLAGGAGDGIGCESVLFGAAAQGGFAAAGGTRYDEECAKHGKSTKYEVGSTK